MATPTTRTKDCQNHGASVYYKQVALVGLHYINREELYVVASECGLRVLTPRSQISKAQTLSPQKRQKPHAQYMSTQNLNYTPQDVLKDKHVLTHRPNNPKEFMPQQGPQKPRRMGKECTGLDSRAGINCRADNKPSYIGCTTAECDTMHILMCSQRTFLITLRMSAGGT